MAGSVACPHARCWGMAAAGLLASRSSRLREGGISLRPHRTGGGRETHPLSLGVLGIFGDGRADEYLFDTPCDLLIAVGVSFGGLVTRLFARWRGLKADVVHAIPGFIGSYRICRQSLGIPTSGRAPVNAP